MEDYSSLRKEKIRLRRELSAEERIRRSDIITDKVVATEEYKNASTVLVYADYNGEVATDRLISRALLDGKKVYAPVCEPDFKLSFYRIFTVDELMISTYGIREPLKIEYLKLDTAKTDDDCVCITPGSVFDRDGHRLGYGKGYYDRFFSETDISHRIGICFDFQIVDHITPNDNDIAMTRVISD